MKKLIFAAIALCMTASLAQSQELKPVKDKTTKKFGYQDESKNWVIRPIYDKAKKFELGVAIVSVDKLEGVIDTEGNLILPFDCSNVKMDNKFELIHAERSFEVENPELYSDPKACAWGVHGDRYIRITPVPFKLSNSDREKPLNAHGMVDDNPESPFGATYRSPLRPQES